MCRTVLVTPLLAGSLIYFPLVTYVINNKFTSFPSFQEMLREWEQALQQHGHSARLIFVEERTGAAILAAFTAFYGSRGDRGLWPRVTFTTDSGVGYGVLRDAFTLFWAAAETNIFTSLEGDLRFPEVTPTRNGRFWEAVGRILGHTLAVLREIPGCIPLYLALMLFNHSSQHNG